MLLVIYYAGILLRELVFCSARSHRKRSGLQEQETADWCSLKTTLYISLHIYIYKERTTS